MTHTEAKFWNPQTNKLTTEPVSDQDSIEKLISELSKKYPNPNTLPGFELVSSNKTYGTLAIAVAPFGWAIIHTSEDHLTQHCTNSKQGSDEESLDVQWEEVDSVPRKWFIPKNEALVGIKQWMLDGTLSPAVAWCDKCY